MEVEAESVAFVVTGIAGFDTSAFSIGYIAGWANEDTWIIQDTASRILRTGRAIAELIDS